MEARQEPGQQRPASMKGGSRRSRDRASGPTPATSPRLNEERLLEEPQPSLPTRFGSSARSGLNEGRLPEEPQLAGRHTASTVSGVPPR